MQLWHGELLTNALAKAHWLRVDSSRSFSSGWWTDVRTPSPLGIRNAVDSIASLLHLQAQLQMSNETPKKAITNTRRLQTTSHVEKPRSHIQSEDAWFLTLFRIGNPIDEGERVAPKNERWSAHLKGKLSTTNKCPSIWCIVFDVADRIQTNTRKVYAVCHMSLEVSTMLIHDAFPS